MNSKFASGLLFVAVAAGTMVFQNCGTYQPNQNLSYTALSECTGTQCVISPDSIQLSIQNANPTLLRKPAPAETETDIGGYCDNGGYVTNEIDWALVDPLTNNTVQSGVGGACDQLGRFEFKVPYPSTYANQTQGLVLHVALYGLEGNQKVINPKGLHYQMITLLKQ